MQGKYGFIYIWHDKKHARFYIGSHWGTEDDGYICSSRWMRNSYRRRPWDFKRRIIQRVMTNRSELLDEEYRWLSYIPEHQLGKKYYNLTNHRQSHWTEDDRKVRSVSHKISETMKAKHQDPEYRKIYEEGQSKRTNIQSEESRAKRSKSMKSTLADKFPIENRHVPVPKGSEQHIDLIKQGVRNYYDNMTPEQAKRRKAGQQRAAASHMGKRHRAGQTNSEQHNLKIAQSNGMAVVIDGIEYHSKEAAGRALSINGNTVGNRIKSDKYPTWHYKR